MERWIVRILDVPLVGQQNGVTCVPACIKMILDYISRAEDPWGDIPEFDVSEISEILKTDELGTSLENIKNLNKNDRILTAIPSIEFVNRHGCKFDEIRTELANNRPVIAWISPSEVFTGLAHSIVITGVDESKLLVYLNDPLLGKKVERLANFSSLWDKADRVPIKVQIGLRTQRKLDEFTKNKREIEQ